jgi:signal transduction histidine kinase
MSSFVLSQKLAHQLLPEAREAEAITKLLQDANDQVREVSHGLCPLQSGGLVAALRELMETTVKRSGFTCHFKNNNDPLIHDRFITGHLFRIAQEAVDNALRHSRGTTLSLGLMLRRSHMILTVRDDGAGLPQNVTRGMGLQTMGYRAALIGGTLSVTNNAKSSGTLVTCSVPVPGQKGRGSAL